MDANNFLKNLKKHLKFMTLDQNIPHLVLYSSDSKTNFFIEGSKKKNFLLKL